MKQRWLPLLVLVHVLLALGGTWWFGWNSYAPGPTYMAWIGLFLAQGNLLALWGVFGGRGTPWRIVATVITLALLLRLVRLDNEWQQFAARESIHLGAGIAAILLLVRLLPQKRLLGVIGLFGAQPWRMVGVLLALGLWMLRPFLHPGQDFAEVVLIQFGTATAIMLLGRWCGLRLVKATEEDRSRRRFQFSLSSMLAWMTGVAFILSTTQWLPSLPFAPEDMVAILCATPIGCVSVYAQLAPSPIRWTVLTLVLVGLASIFCLVEFRNWPADVYLIPTLFGSEAAWAMASAAVIRAAGYRLVWRRRTHTSYPPPV